MNEDPNNLQIPHAPLDPTVPPAPAPDLSAPAMASAPVSPMAPEAPAAPMMAAPDLSAPAPMAPDPSLGAAPAAPGFEAAPAAAPMDASMNPAMMAAPAANPSLVAAQTIPGPDPFAAPAQSTPSVAFNDPAQAPDAPQFGKKPSPFDFIKKVNPVVLIVGGGLIVIIALVLILAFA